MMSQQQRLTQLILPGTLLLCLLVGAYLLVWRQSSKSEPAGKVIKHPVDTPPDDALKYWTANKMRDARGIDLPETENLKREKQQDPPSHPKHS